MFGLAVPVIVATKTFVFAPVGGWHSDVIVNPPRSFSPLFPEISAVTLDELVNSMAISNYLVSTPLQKFFREQGALPQMDEVRNVEWIDV